MLARRAALTFAGLGLVLVVGFIALPTPRPEGGAAPALVIDDVRYFDGQRMRGPAAIVIENGRISAITAPGAAPSAAQRIDASGGTLLPGLIDAHVHTFGSSRRDALDFGVTTVIDMFTAATGLRGAAAEREAFDASDRAALFSAGMLATVPGGHGTQYGIPIDTLAGPGEAAAWVAARVAEGSDFIKLVYMPGAEHLPSLDLATATALITAAHDAGLQAVAHIASLRGARDLLDAGIDGFVHVFADALADDAFIERAVERGIFVVPTLAVIAMADGRSTGPALAEDPFLAPRLGAAARANLRQDFGRAIPSFDLDTALENVARLHSAGVPILAGSDAPNPGTAHGATLHAELDLLVRAGLSEVEALAAATSAPAKAFSLEGRGRIAVGERADLVLVAGTVDRDIRATRDIEWVLRNGQPVSPPAPVADDVVHPVSGTLGDFDRGLAAPAGLAWSATSDRMMGGRSSADIERVPRGDGAALRVTADVRAGFAFPWAGAYIGPASQAQVGDLGNARGVAFDVRGTPARYRLMVFVSGSLGAPPTAEFGVTDDWQRVSIPLDSLPGVVPARFGGLAIVTPTRAGHYQFAIDNVTLIH